MLSVSTPATIRHLSNYTKSTERYLMTKPPARAICASLTRAERTTCFPPAASLRSIHRTGYAHLCYVLPVRSSIGTGQLNRRTNDPTSIAPGLSEATTHEYGVSCTKHGKATTKEPETARTAMDTTSRLLRPVYCTYCAIQPDCDNSGCLASDFGVYRRMTVSCPLHGSRSRQKKSRGHECRKSFGFHRPECPGHRWNQRYRGRY